MNSQLTSNAEALRLFFTEDIYLVEDKFQAPFAEPVSVAVPEMQSSNPPVIMQSNEALAPQAAIVAESKPLPKKTYTFEFLGKNQKGILILVHDEVHKVSSPVGTELLRKLVKAIELTNNDFALINYAHYPEADFETLKSFFNCQLVLSFGVSTQQIGLEDQVMHQITTIAETQFIFTKNLHELDSDQQSKKILWTSLQQLK